MKKRLQSIAHIHMWVISFITVHMQVCTEIKPRGEIANDPDWLLILTTEGGKEVTLWWLKKVGGPKGMGRWEHCWRTLLSVEKPNARVGKLVTRATSFPFFLWPILSIFLLIITIHRYSFSILKHVFLYALSNYYCDSCFSLSWTVQKYLLHRKKVL